MRKKKLIKLNKELEIFPLEDKISTCDSLSPFEKELLEVNKEMAQMALEDEFLTPEEPEPKKTRKRKSRKVAIPADNESSLIEDSKKNLLILEHQAMANQAEAAKGSTQFAAGVVLASFLSIFIPGFFGMGLVLVGVTCYMYYKAEKKQKEYEKSAEEIRVRLATFLSQN